MEQRKLLVLITLTLLFGLSLLPSVAFSLEIGDSPFTVCLALDEEMRSTEFVMWGYDGLPEMVTPYDYCVRQILRATYGVNATFQIIGSINWQSPNSIVNMEDLLDVMVLQVDAVLDMLGCYGECRPDILAGFTNQEGIEARGGIADVVDNVVLIQHLCAHFDDNSIKHEMYAHLFGAPDCMSPNCVMSGYVHFAWTVFESLLPICDKVVEVPIMQSQPSAYLTCDLCSECALAIQNHNDSMWTEYRLPASFHKSFNVYGIHLCRSELGMPEVNDDKRAAIVIGSVVGIALFACVSYGLIRKYKWSKG